MGIPNIGVPVIDCRDSQKGTCSFWSPSKTILNWSTPSAPDDKHRTTLLTLGALDRTPNTCGDRSKPGIGTGETNNKAVSKRLQLRWLFARSWSQNDLISVFGLILDSAINIKGLEKTSGVPSFVVSFLKTAYEERGLPRECDIAGPTNIVVSIFFSYPHITPM